MHCFACDWCIFCVLFSVKFSVYLLLFERSRCLSSFCMCFGTSPATLLPDLLVKSMAGGLFFSATENLCSTSDPAAIALLINMQVIVSIGRLYSQHFPAPCLILSQPLHSGKTLPTHGQHIIHRQVFPELILSKSRPCRNVGPHELIPPSPLSHGSLSLRPLPPIRGAIYSYSAELGTFGIFEFCQK